MQHNGLGDSSNILLSARLVPTSPSSSPFTPVGHSLHVAIVNLALEECDGKHEREEWSIEVDGLPHACPEIARGSPQMLGLKLVLRNFVMMHRIESAVVVVDSICTDHVVLTLGDDDEPAAPPGRHDDGAEQDIIPSSSSSSSTSSPNKTNPTLRVRVCWFRHDGSSPLQQRHHQSRIVRPATSGTQRTAGLQQRQLPGWTTSSLFMYGPNHTHWVPTDDAKSRVLLDARVKDSPRMLLLDSEESAASTPRAKHNATKPARLVASARSCRSQPQLSAATFPILIRPLPQPRKHHQQHREAAATAPTEVVAWKQQGGGRRVVATEASRTSHDDADHGQRFQKRAARQAPATTTSAGVNPRLYTPQKTDPALVAASWKRKLSGLREESEHMEIYLNQAKLLDGLFLPGSA